MSHHSCVGSPGRRPEVSIDRLISLSTHIVGRAIWYSRGPAIMIFISSDFNWLSLRQTVLSRWWWHSDILIHQKLPLRRSRTLLQNCIISVNVYFPPIQEFSKKSNALLNLGWVRSRISVKYFWNFLKLLKASLQWSADTNQIEKNFERLWKWKIMKQYCENIMYKWVERGYLANLCTLMLVPAAAGGGGEGRGGLAGHKAQIEAKKPKVSLLQ